MNPFEAFIMHQAIKSHFNNEKYDYFKFNGKVRANFLSFEKRKDKYFYRIIASHIDPEGLILSNILYDKKAWSGDIVDDEGYEKYYEWKKRSNAIIYNLEKDIKNMLTKFDDNVIIENNQKPHLMTLFLQKQITLETITIIASLVKCLDYWTKNTVDPLVLEKIFIIKKYAPFLNFDEKNVKNILKNTFN